MTEQNDHLEHRSRIEGVAHTCGHDGHLATLLATIPSFLEKLKKVPRNKTVRLVFQPSEEDI
jgi:hippurate hydrolase